MRDDVTTRRVVRFGTILLVAGGLMACGAGNGGAGGRDTRDDPGADAFDETLDGGHDVRPGSDLIGGEGLLDTDGRTDVDAQADTRADALPDLPVGDVPVLDVPTADAASYTAAFQAPELLGRPTATSIAVNVLPAVDLEVRLAWGSAAAALEHETAVVSASAGQPAVLRLDGLQPDAAFHYQVRWRLPGDQTFVGGPARSFHTARPAGEGFTFTVQADSHLDENSNADVYARALDNVAADAPDFHVDLGDTFMCEKHSQPFDATVAPAPDSATVDARYLFERGNFGRATHSVPLFLVNGNHEGEAGWLLDDTADNLAVWATKARLAYFLNPTPDVFYGGDPSDPPFTGPRASYYTWTWGDAQFVVLDPYWSSTQKPGQDAWALTLGQAQYQWLTATLEASTARYVFVFVHNLVGGLDKQMRGGVEAAPYYEWGGKDEDGTDTFSTHRPGWAMPIHDLLVKHHVAVVFHGHDHVYAKQDLDGIVYQEVPQPSASNLNGGASLAAKYHYASGTILSSPGHLRVSVGPDQARVEYVRAFRAADENGQRHNGQIDDTYTLAPRAPASR